MTPSRPIQLYRFQPGGLQPIHAEIVTEIPVDLTVNGESWLTFMCTPQQLEALAAGFLYTEDIITESAEIADVRLCEHGDNVDIWLTHAVEKPSAWTRTSGCTGGQTGVTANSPKTAPRQISLVLSPEKITQLVARLFEAQEIYKETGGIHTTALSDGENVLLSVEDIGRHNTLDKLAGRMLLENVWPEKRVLITTGRISSEMMQKAGRIGAEFVISRTSPTSQSVELAEEFGITLIGYARRDRFNIYSHPERIQ